MCVIIWGRQGCGFAVERGVWHSAVSHSKCPTGWLLVLPFPTFVDRERPDGHLTGSVRISGATEILPKDEGSPG